MDMAQDAPAASVVKSQATKLMTWLSGLFAQDGAELGKKYGI
jgi:hypothetical protein